MTMMDQQVVAWASQITGWEHKPSKVEYVWDFEYGMSFLRVNQRIITELNSRKEPTSLYIM